MQWRPFTRVFARPKYAHRILRSAFIPRHKLHVSQLQRRSFHFSDGKSSIQESAVQRLQQPQPDWADEIDGDMAHQELSQLQQFLGLIEPKNGKPVENVVFVCIDCEAYESDHSKITEIGVSVLDSRSVKGVDPGDNGQPWFDLMKHLHLRPIEYKKLVNRKFVKGCPDRFNFGESAFIQLDDAGRIMERIFRDPSRIHEACEFATEIQDVAPSIMLIGHDLKNDTEYLKKLNFTPKHVTGTIDTQRLARISKRMPPGLKKLLTALSIDAQNLHNAGNDAAYTLQALIGVAVQEHQRPGEIVLALKAEKELLDAARLAKKANAKKRIPPWVAKKRALQANADPGATASPPVIGAGIASPPDESRREHKSRVRHERQEQDE